MENKLRYFIIYKPYGMLSQFSDADGHPTLKSLHHFPKDVYPVGRLDKDSEGLLLLTNDKRVNHKLLDPQYQHERTYLVQVDGAIHQEAIQQLESGVTVSINKKKYHTLPATAKVVTPPDMLPERDPPVRFRKSIPTSWITLGLTEGKNRQVRKMTAQVGFPTLRLIRVSIEKIQLSEFSSGFEPGFVQELNKQSVYKALFNTQ